MLAITLFLPSIQRPGLRALIGTIGILMSAKPELW